MIGAWFLDSQNILLSVVRLLAVFLVLYFLAVTIYWFNRTGKVPSLRVIWRTMIQLAKWFPRILIYRVRIVPARIRRKKVNAYPDLPNSRMSAKLKKAKKKSVRVKKK